MKGPPIGWPFLCPRDLDGQCLEWGWEVSNGDGNRANSTIRSARKHHCRTLQSIGRPNQTVKSEVRRTEELFQGLLAQRSEG